jgi:hypothetical protein
MKNKDQKKQFLMWFNPLNLLKKKIIYYSRKFCEKTLHFGNVA